MTTRKWHISPHFDQPHTRLDQLAILAGARITRDRLRIPCPAHGGTNPNLELRVAGDLISANCFSQGCSYREIAQAIEAKSRDLHRPRPYPGREDPRPHRAQASSITQGSTGPQDPRPATLAPLHSHPQVLRPSRQEVACQPPSLAPRTASARASALDQGRTPSP